LKKNITKLCSSWRNYTSVKVETQVTGTPQRPKKPNSTKPTINEAKPVVPSAKGVGFPSPSASQVQNNYKKLSKKLDSQSGIKTMEEQMMHGEHNAKLELFMDKMRVHDYKKYRKFIEYRGNKRLYRNLNPAKGQNIRIDKKGTRRLSTDFARIISKIAEDNSGELVDGNQKWDIDKILNRTLDNRNILHCKSTEELECLLLILDSSPSCERYAKMYAEIASVASEFSDVDMFNAPNARIFTKYNIRKKEFVKCWSAEDVINLAHKWKYFKNRTILFFGDSDGIRTVMNASLSNNIHWFTPDMAKHVVSDLSEYGSTPYNNRNIKIYGDITSIEKFIKAVKNMK
jgi:hypothetical protein